MTVDRGVWPRGNFRTELNLGCTRRSEVRAATTAGTKQRGRRRKTQRVFNPNRNGHEKTAPFAQGTENDGQLYIHKLEYRLYSIS